MAANRPDYLVATTLPYMQLVHENESDDRWKEFTVDEARQLYVDGLPLLMNHNDGDTGGPLIEVGRVKASVVSGSSAKVLATIDPRRSEEATFASNAVATGIYEDVSLGHQVEVNVRSALEDGIATYTKTPREVSLCRKGARYGSTINAFCPGRATLERLAEHAPDDLAKMVERHGYAQPLIDLGVEATDRERYIEALATLSDSRLAEVIDREALRPRPPPAAKLMTSPMPPAAATEKVLASDSTPATPPAAEENQAPPPPSAAAAAAPPPPAATYAATPVAEPPAPLAVEPTRSIETPSTGPTVDGSIPPHEWAKVAVQAQKDSKQVAEALAEERAKIAQMQAELEEARLAKTELAERKAKDKEKRKAELESVIKSLRQYGAAGGIAKDTIEKQIETARDYEETNPDVTMALVQQAHTMAVHASQERDKHERAQATAMAANVASFNNTFLDSKAKEFAQLRAETVALQRAAVAPTALSTRFEPAPSPPEPMAVPPAASSVASPAAAPAPAAHKRSFEDYVEQEAPPHFVMASDDKFPVAALREKYMQDTRKHPSYSDLAYGVHYEATGKVQMSADGRTEEPVVERKRLRRTPAKISPWNYAPRWAATLEGAMGRVSSNVRGGTSMRLRMVEQGPKV